MNSLVSLIRNHFSFDFTLQDLIQRSTFQILILSSVVAVSMAYPYPMPVPVAIAYPQSVPSYVAPPKFEERADVGLDRSGHHGYDEHLGRVKMQVCTSNRPASADKHDENPPRCP